MRRLHTDELPEAIRRVELAFGYDSRPDDLAQDLNVLDAGRCLAVFEDGGPVATAGSFAFDMTVPGGRLPVAGVTFVSVAPTHRRQGLLRRMMDRQLGDLHEQGTAVAALWATEGAIYQQYGYGPAAWHQTLELPRGAAFVRPVDATGLRLVEPAAAPLATAYDEVAARTPGWFVRDDPWWGYRLYDPEHRRAGSSAFRCVVDGEDGYALYVTTPNWAGPGPAGTVGVVELVARTPGSAARLWRYLLDQDLMAVVKAPGRPLDDPVLHLLGSPRSAQARLTDGLWVRLVSVPDGLAGRAYAAAVDVVLDVTDVHCPWNAGRWRLSGDGSGATCAPTNDAADLVLDVRDLGAAYLGSTPLAARGRAGWVEERTSGALAAASTAFGWAGPAASCPVVF